MSCDPLTPQVDFEGKQYPAKTLVATGQVGGITLWAR